MTQPTDTTSLSPAQQTFQGEIQPLVNSGKVSPEDLKDATDALITIDRTPNQCQAMKRVWTAYTGGDPNQLPEDV